MPDWLDLIKNARNAQFRERLNSDPVLLGALVCLLQIGVTPEQYADAWRIMGGGG